MNETELLAETRRWLRYAREDLVAAEAMLEQGDIAPRHVCWLAQQSAEKAIKAVPVFLQIDFPKSHDLDALRNLTPEGWQFKVAFSDLANLTEWAKARYPGDWPEVVKEDARVAMTQARALWTAIRADFAQRGFEK